MSDETKRSLNGPAKFTISLGSGVLAGFAAAILSQVSESEPHPYLGAHGATCATTARYLLI